MAAVKYFIKDQNETVNMGITNSLNFMVKEDVSRASGYSDLEVMLDKISCRFNVKDENINVKINGSDRTVDEAIGRIFDNIDEVKSVAIIAKGEYLDIQILMSR